MSVHILPALPSYPLPFGTTTTTTFSATTTATIGAVLHLSIPVPATPPPTSYTTSALPTSAGAKAYPHGLPILVLTQLDAVVFDPEGSTVVSTVTTVQRAPGETGPAGGTGGDDGGDRPAYVDHGWGDWTGKERAGVIVALVLAVVGVTAMGLWWTCRRGVWGPTVGKKGEMGMRLKDLGDDIKGFKRKKPYPKKRTRFDLADKDVERASWEDIPEKELSGIEEAAKTVIPPAVTVGAVPGKPARGTGGRSDGPAGSAYQMSGGMPSPDFYGQEQSLQSLPAHQGSRERLADHLAGSKSRKI